MVHSARHEEVTRALGRGARQDRRLDLGQPALGATEPHRLREFVAHPETSLHCRTSQVVDSVLETTALVELHVVLDLERRRRGRVEDANLVRDQLDRARRQVRVHDVRVPAGEHTPHDQHPLGSHRLRLGVCLGLCVRLEDDLRDPAPVAQIYEDHAAVVAPLSHPAAENHFAADVARSHLSTEMCSAQIAEWIELQGGSLCRVGRFGARSLPRPRGRVKVRLSPRR